MEDEPTTEAGRTGQDGEDANAADPGERDQRAGGKPSGGTGDPSGETGTGGEEPSDSPGPLGNPQVDEEALRNEQQ